MKLPDATAKPSQNAEVRRKPRSKDLSNPMVEIKIPGNPIYQLKVRDISDEGVGVLVRPDSKLLNLIEVGHEISVRLVLPRNYRGPSGNFRTRVEHITEIEEGPFQGHLVVGISFLPPLGLTQSICNKRFSDQPVPDIGWKVCIRKEQARQKPS
jgi:hypothetical protein